MKKQNQTAMFGDRIKIRACIEKNPINPEALHTYLIFWMELFQWTTLLEEKTVIVELGESRPWNINQGLLYTM